jgi:predicted RNase H-like HicB family nuclease
MECTVVLQRESDGGYVAAAPALPGCVSQGDSRAEVLKNIEEAIELYLEDVREAGQAIAVEADREYVEVTTSLSGREFRPISPGALQSGRLRRLVSW